MSVRYSLARGFLPLDSVSQNMVPKLLDSAGRLSVSGVLDGTVFKPFNSLVNRDNRGHGLTLKYSAVL